MKLLFKFGVIQKASISARQFADDTRTRTEKDLLTQVVHARNATCQEGKRELRRAYVGFKSLF